ncbi:MAG: glycosyltransferase family 9 protein [Verrucomicrobiota bacterium]
MLFNISHIQFCSLAVDPDAQKEVEELQSYPNVYNIGQRLRNFSETAAVLSQVDLLITIDSAVAHLGGALGRPVWLILPSSAEWRWSTFLSRGGSDSPWYTSVRIFRALAFDDWDPVFVRIGKSLSKFLPDKHSEPAFPQSSEAPEVQ